MFRVGIVCDTEFQDGLAGHRAGDEYVGAIRDGAGALPLLIPVTERPLPVGDVLASVDGLLLPGAVSNVEPSHYGGEGPGTMPDRARDATSLALIRAAIENRKPLLAICRGFQELNVALGGSLHQHIHRIPGRLDHREPKDAPLEAQYAPAHSVAIVPGGLLARLLGPPPDGGNEKRHEIMVNSLHHQGIDRLAPGLAVEATAPDGQIEAVSLPDGFVLGTQWHPEWRWAENPVSRTLFSAFGAALGK